MLNESFLLNSPILRPKKSCLFPVTLQTHIFDKKNNDFFFVPTYLPFCFSDCYRKQTISFFRPKL